MKLYSYYRSSATYRVRIGLALKGLAYDYFPVNLLRAQQKSGDYMAKNPQGLVPALETDDGILISQSVAILEWLETTHPDPALLPSDSVAAAQVRAAALVVACDIHPVNNLKVGAELKEMGHGQDDVVAWMNDWMTRGFAAYQALLPGGTEFSFGDAPDNLSHF